MKRNEILGEISDKALRDYKRDAHTEIQGARFGRGKGTPEGEKTIAKREKGMAAADKRSSARDDERRANYKRPEPAKGSSGPQDWYGQNRYMGDSVSEVAGAQKCWPGHRKVGTQPGTGKNAGKRVNDCEKIKEDDIEEAAKKGLYYNVNKRKAAGTSRPASSAKAPTDQAWRDAAKTAKKEGVAEASDNKLTPQQKAHERNLDAAQREMDRRHTQGEDMTGAKIDKKTYKIVKPKKQGVAEGSLNEDKGFDVVKSLVSAFNDSVSGDANIPLAAERPGSRVFTRSDGTRYRDHGNIRFYQGYIDPQDVAKWKATKPVEKFSDWLKSQPGVKSIGQVSGEFRQDPMRDAVAYKGLYFVLTPNGSVIWGSVSRFKNPRSVWRQQGPDQGVAEGEQRMSRAAKGYEKYGKAGMTALAKAGREGAGEEKLDKIRDKHDKYGDSVEEGYTVTPGIDRERYQARDGLEGPFSTKSGKVVYYDKAEGKYYDPDTDMYIEYSDWQAMNEAEYQGRKVPLGKPMQGDVAKSKVYVKNPQGNVVKVNFGDKNMRIKKSIPGRRKNFRARHNCDNPGPRHKARYWSCRAW